MAVIISHRIKRKEFKKGVIPQNDLEKILAKAVEKADLRYPFDLYFPSFILFYYKLVQRHLFTCPNAQYIIAIWSMSIALV